MEKSDNEEEVNQVEIRNGEEWERIRCTADSGAFRTVTNPKVAAETELVVTPEANAGVEFTAANGTAITVLRE